jgi:hypothetical protein
MSISWPGPLQTPRLVDFDVQRKKRIDSWLRHRFDTGGSFDDTPELLLDFEIFLMEEEARRIKE